MMTEAHLLGLWSEEKEPVSKHLKRWGVVYIFLVMWLGSMVVHYNELAAKSQNEAAEHSQEWSHSDFVTEFLSDTFENHQSEYAQLFFQTLLVVGYASVIFKKEKEDTVRQEAKLDALGAALVGRNNFERHWKDDLRKREPDHPDVS